MRYLLLLLLSFPAYATVWHVDAQFDKGRQAHGTIDVTTSCTGDDCFLDVKDWKLNVGDFVYTPQNSEGWTGNHNGEPQVIFQSATRGIVLSVSDEIIKKTSGSYPLNVELWGSDYPSVEKTLANEAVTGVFPIVSGCAALDSTPCHLVPEPSSLIYMLAALCLLRMRRLLRWLYQLLSRQPRPTTQ